VVRPTPAPTTEEDPVPDTDDQLLSGGEGDGDRAVAGEAQSIPVNLYVTSGAAVVVAPLPGVMADDITAVIEDGTVTISAEMRTEAPKDYVIHEWHYGPYARTVDLPAGFAGDADATFANGQLALRVTKGEGGGRQSVTITPKP
jgi:HSP20 family protein